MVVNTSKASTRLPKNIEVATLRDDQSKIVPGQIRVLVDLAIAVTINKVKLIEHQHFDELQQVKKTDK